jgi:hypothetical protein
MEVGMKHLSLAASALIVGGTLLITGVPASAAPIHPTPAASRSAIVLVLCKYGTRNCVNPNPGPKPPKVGGAKMPDSGWEDPDCKYYGSCGTGTPGNWGDPAAARLGSSVLQRQPVPPTYR